MPFLIFIVLLLKYLTIMKTILTKSLCVATVLISFLNYAQAPNISYTTPNTFVLNNAISPLVPTNSGGAVITQTLVSTFAGSGVVGSDDGNGILATFNLPTVVTVDPLSNVVYAVDRMNNKIRKIMPNGDVTTFAGSGLIGSADGSATDASFYYPDGAVVDYNGNVFVTDQSNHKIRKITPDGTVSTFAGSGSIGSDDGNGIVASFYYPAGIAVDILNNLYIADYGNNKIRKITPSGDVTTFAGTGVVGSDDGPALTSKFNGVTGVVVDAAGNVFAADYYNNKIRKIDINGDVTTIAGTGAAGADDGLGNVATFDAPAIVAVDINDNLFITDENNNKIRKITPDGMVSTYAGNGVNGFADGNASIAEFKNATGIAVDTNHNVYVADYGNNKIRKINSYGYSISPVLPQGLSFDVATGIISGTPTTEISPTDFIITANNPDGEDSFVINISVNALGTENFNVTSLYFYPNPVQNILNISSSKIISDVKIINLLGQEVLSESFQDKTCHINLASLSNGLYVVKAKSGKEENNFKIIKQ